MTDPFFELLVLPFQATRLGTSEFLSFEQTMSMLRRGQRIQIERSYPGAPHAIGWTIFRRTTKTYLYENEPFFRFERGARKYIRKAYAIHYASLTSEDGITYSHLQL
jgi:hypothetical protein